MKSEMMKRLNNFDIKMDIYTDNPEAYEKVDLSYAYQLLAGASPSPAVLKSFDAGILKSFRSLENQILADGLSHARVSVFGEGGKFYDVLNNPEENARIRAFYLILDRTLNVGHTEQLLKKYDFNSREEVIQHLPELYTEGAEPRLKIGKTASIRDIVKVMTAK